MARDMLPLFTLSYGDVVDLSWLAPDQSSYECTGKPVVITGMDGTMETLLPCGWVLPADCFRPQPESPYGDSRKRPVRGRCVACEEKIRTTRNRLDFWGKRITEAVRRHYKKERAEHLHAAQCFSDYLMLTGIELGALATRAREAAERDHKCQHCQKRWSEMPGGAIMHLSLDRRDPERPLSMDNYSFICRTGNSQYARVAPRARTIRDAMYRIKAEHGIL
jgi:hypothetical protein